MADYSGAPNPGGAHPKSQEFRKKAQVAALDALAEVQVDAINPAHYQGFSNGAEVIDVVENLPYNRGAAIKYLARAGKKAIADELEDLRKSEWYVQREIRRLEIQKENADDGLA